MYCIFVGRYGNATFKISSLTLISTIAQSSRSISFSPYGVKSALDAESEHLVQKAIDNAVVGRTTIIVAHRLSTIKNANQIIVLDGQEIVDCGSHNALMRRCSKYQDLIKRQSVVRIS